MVARQAAAWRAQDIALPIDVNLTAADLLDSSLPGRIRRLLEGHELSMGALELRAPRASC